MSRDDYHARLGTLDETQEATADEYTDQVPYQSIGVRALLTSNRQTLEFHFAKSHVFQNVTRTYAGFKLWFVR